MGFEERINKWIIGAVMGRKHVYRYEDTKKIVDKEHTPKEGNTKKSSKISEVKGFLELGVGELKSNIKGKISSENDDEYSDDR
ncbi:MAG: hypothetical protein PHU61_01185 [Candidatus Absconditabacteria bacterium]|nr:hypothetical protein [Candidatus Absconditabacteria bacterium]MDD3868087.1 hypothetical protein [Candidatus Absconditabacteria bacterium]MDD4714334.1 hypothetical protein [Candidatus Absconditabacteria bacterium]